MQFENMFSVPLSLDDAWRVLMDVERIAPCMPGAELTEVVDKTNYKGRISVRLGPVALTFAGTVRLEDIDEANHTARIKALGSDAKGRGGAQATAVFRLEPKSDATDVIVSTELTLSGTVAQYGRGVGIIQATANQMIQQFATCLKSELTRQTDIAASDTTPARSHMDPVPNLRPATKPIAGFALIWNVLLESIRNLFRSKSSKA